MAVWLFAAIACTGQECPQPPAIQAVPRESNIFSDRQEVDLGDAISEHLAHEFKLLEDEELNAYLTRVGQRIARHLPPNQLQFRFYIMDAPEVNAYGIAGGRIYVSRKLITYAANEDELAGVLAHEMGHIVTHQQAIEFTRFMRDVLGVTQVGERADIFDKYQRLMENFRRKRAHGSREEERQYVADQVALYAVARAGYSPQAYVQLWDRFNELHGKAGSWLANVFGNVKPEQRRLREMLKAVSAMPAACSESRPPAASADFRAWQDSVLQYSGRGRKETLPGLVYKKDLETPLRPDIDFLRFSPDGKYILAQDDASIYVLSRQPFAPLFRIDAPDAYPPQFTPDSKSLVFYNPSLRVEAWNIAEQRQAWVHEISINKHCFQDALSPDGTVLACIDSQFDLALIDVRSGATLFSKKEYVHLGLSEAFVLLVSTILGEGHAHLMEMAFSPNGRCFLAGHRGQNIAVDVPSRREMSVGSGVRSLLSYSFAFLGPERLVGVNLYSPAKSQVVSFPGGQKLQEVTMGQNKISAAAHGDYLMLRPVKDYPVAILDIKANKLLIGNRHSALDVYDDMYVSERVSGELGLYPLTSTSPVAMLTLPSGPLGPLHAAAWSPDMRYLAFSSRSRGAVWELNSNHRIQYIRPFQGAWFSPDDALYADFSKFFQSKRVLGRIELTTNAGSDAIALDEDHWARQYGPYLVRRKFDDKNPLVEVQDVRSGATLWSRAFGKGFLPLAGAGDQLVIWGPVKEGPLKDEAKSFPELRARAEEQDYLLESLALPSGKLVGKALVKTGKDSIRIARPVADGDWVAFEGGTNEVLIYGLSSGVQVAHVLGSRPILCSASGLLAVENGPGRVTVYELPAARQRTQFLFPTPLAFKAFSPDGRRLLALSSDQKVYLLDLAAPPSPPAGVNRASER